MKSRLSVLFLIVLYAACPRPARALAGGELLLADKGARASALAGALSAVPEAGPFGSAYNPAGLADQDGLAFGFEHNEWGLDMRGDYLSAACPLPQGAAAGALDYFSYGAVETVDENGQAGGETFVPSLLGLKLAYGLRVNPELAVGAQLNFYRESIRDYSDLGGGLDLGALWRSPWEGVRLGLAVRHIGATASGYRLPGAAVLGCSWMNAMVERLALFAETEYLWTDTEWDAALAAEYQAFSWAALRLGYRHRFLDAADPGPGVTCGLGLRWRDWQLGYALLPLGEFGLAHKISLEYALKPAAARMKPQPGASPAKSAETMAKQLDGVIYKRLELGKKHFAAGNYKAAINEWKMVLDIAPGHAGAGELIGQAETKWKEQVEKCRREARQARERKDLAEEIAGWKKVLALSPGDKEAGLGLEQARKLAPALIRTLYNQGVDEYGKGRYREAIRTWERVLLLDPQHYKALENIQRTKEKLIKIE